MTSGIMDTCRYVNKVYDILALEEELPFNPKDYDIKAIPHPACWRGYFAEYAFINKKLTLADLNIYSSSNYPLINGKKNMVRQGILSDFRMYKDLNLEMKYSGGMIIGKDFLPKYYKYMGKQTPHTFQVIYELIFEKGEIVHTIDRSEEMKNLRERFSTPYTENIKIEILDEINKVFERTYKY